LSFLAVTDGNLNHCVVSADALAAIGKAGSAAAVTMQTVAPTPVDSNVEIPAAQ
jgi:hypothetical protein